MHVSWGLSPPLPLKPSDAPAYKYGTVWKRISQVLQHFKTYCQEALLGQRNKLYLLFVYVFGIKCSIIGGDIIKLL